METERYSLSSLNNFNNYTHRTRGSSASFHRRESIVNTLAKDKTIDEEAISTEKTVVVHDDQFPEGGLKANLVVLGGFFSITIVFGLMNSVGVIQAHVAEHILPHVSTSEVGWIFSVYFFFSFFGGIYAGPLFDYKGATIPMYLGSVLIVGGLFATASCQTVWQFVLAFGLVVGVGSSFLMNCCIASVSHYFLKKRGTALGVCSIGGSLGGVVWPLLFRSLFPKVGFGWAMRIYGFITCFFLGIGCLLVKNRLTKSVGDKKGLALVKDSFVLQELIKDRTYLCLAISILLCEFSLVLTITYASSYTMAKGYSESQAFLVSIINNAFGIPGRYLPNYLADRYGSLNVMGISVSICSLLILAVWLPFGESLTCMYVFAGLYGFFSSSTMSLTPVCCGVVGKAEDFGKRYGTVYFLVAFGNLISLPIGGAIISNGTGYSNMIIFCGVIEGVAALFWLITRFTVVKWKWAAI
jgi:MFS family permease